MQLTEFPDYSLTSTGVVTHTPTNIIIPKYRNTKGYQVTLFKDGKNL
jgi:hypothetical protein